MNYREYPKHGDPVLGAFAVGTLLLILAWVVAGIDVLAMVALLIAFGYVRMAGTLKPSGMPVSAEAESREPGRTPHALATDARFHGRAAAGTRTQRRSAYDGLAN